MSSEVELLPCPLCGVRLFHNGASPLGDIYEHPNNGCAMQVAWFTATPELVKKWNRRSASPSIGRVGVADVDREPAEERFKAAIGRYEEPWELADGLRESAFYWRDKPPSDYAAQPRIMADFHDRAAVALERLIALVYYEEPAGDTQGALPVTDETQPAIWVSAAQLAEHVDPDPRDGSEGGNYLPARKTRRGLFQTPLYTHPAALVSPPDNGEAATSVDQRAAMAETVRQITSMLEWGDVPLSAGEVKLVEHIKGMPSRMTQDFSQAKIGRWLGWVQGAACAKGWLLLDDCKRINAQFSPALQSHNEGSDGK